MDNYYMMGQAAYQDAINAGSSPEDAAQTAGDMMSQGLADAGFPPDMIQAGMDAGIANYTDAIAGGMSPADAFSQAANIGMDAGAQVFDDQMPDMDEIGMTAFQDAIANGAPPAEAAQSAANAISQAGQDFGIPPEMIEAGLSAGMEAFNQAMANGDTPEGAFGTALEVGGEAADGVMEQAGFDMDFVDMQDGMAIMDGGVDAMGGMNADMMGAMPPDAMGGMNADMMGAMPPEAMGGFDASMMQMMPPEGNGWNGTRPYGELST